MQLKDFLETFGHVVVGQLVWKSVIKALPNVFVSILFPE